MHPENAAQQPHDAVLPDKSSNLSKKEQVADMFDRISGKYDFLNHFLSFNIDKGWRRKTIREVMAVQPKQILDVATGTADLAIEAVRAGAPSVTGVDISEGMLDVGRKKLREKALDKYISLQYGDSEHLPFTDASFDVVMCSFGVRNFEHLQRGLTEMNRVLRPGGKIVVLEFSHPKTFPVAQIYRFYSKFILPRLGNIVSKHSRAYTYLPESVAAFPEGSAFAAQLATCGYINATVRPLTFGISTLYTAVKK